MLITKRRLLFTIAVGLVSLLLPSCGFLSPQPTLTPIYVTPTPRIEVVTPTASPVASPVIAPTFGSGELSTQQAQLPATITPTTVITMTPTFTPTPTDTPVTPGGIVIAPVGGVGVDTVGVSGFCQTSPSGGFSAVYSSNTALSAQLSCPIDAAQGIVTAYQTFERGLMVWVSQVGTSGQSGIYVFYNNNTYQRFADTWRDGVDPTSSGAVAPDGLQEPIRGFGKVWRESGGVRDGLGWATRPEVGGNGTIQVFERGEMVYIQATGQTYIAVAGTPGTWSAVSIPY